MPPEEGFEKTGRDRWDGATRKSVLQEMHADYPGNSASTQRAGAAVGARATNAGLPVRSAK